MPGSLPFYHVVAAIVWQPEKDNTFLIAKRQKGKHLAGFWELPGGKLEPGESRLKGLRRELKEELNIHCTDTRPYQQVRHDYKDRSILLDVWEVRAFEGVVEACEDQEVHWVKVENIGRYRFPEADQPILDTIKNNAKVKRVHHP